MGRAPTSGTRHTPNMTNPTMAALSGAMSGAGIGGKLQNFFSGFGGGSPSPYSRPGQGYKYTKAQQLVWVALTLTFLGVRHEFTNR